MTHRPGASEWDHVSPDADWEWNTDNQNDNVLEEAVSSDGRSRVAAADDVEQDPDAEVVDEAPDEEQETTEDQEAPAPVVQGQLPGSEVSPDLKGYFEPADEVSQFEPGTNVILEGMPGEVIEVFPVEGEAHVKVKLASGLTGFFHWKDLLVYIPTAEELKEQMMAEMGMEPDLIDDEGNPIEDPRQAGAPLRSSESKFNRRWAQLAEPAGVAKAWYQVREARLGDEVALAGQPVRVIGRLADGRVHVQSGSVDQIVDQTQLEW